MSSLPPTVAPRSKICLLVKNIPLSVTKTEFLESLVSLIGDRKASVRTFSKPSGSEGTLQSLSTSYAIIEVESEEVGSKLLRLSSSLTGGWVISSYATGPVSTRRAVPMTAPSQDNSTSATKERDRSREDYSYLAFQQSPYMSSAGGVAMQRRPSTTTSSTTLPQVTSKPVTTDRYM